MTAQSPSGVEDAAHAARGLHECAGHLLELDDLVAPVDGGQVLARVLSEEGLLVRNRLIHARGEEGPLLRLVEAGGLHDGFVVGVGRQLRAQAVPGLL